MPRPIRATDLGERSRTQFDASQAAMPARAKVWAVIKANAYGHGLERAARALAAADGFARARLPGGRAAARRRRGEADPDARRLLPGGRRRRSSPSTRSTPVIHNAEQLEMLARGRARAARSTSISR